MDRHTAYRRSLCVDCTTAPHSAGRPRCDSCHLAHTRVVPAPPKPFVIELRLIPDEPGG